MKLGGGLYRGIQVKALKNLCLYNGLPKCIIVFKGVYKRGVKMDKLTIKQAAKALKVSEQTVRRRIAKGILPAKKEMTTFGEVWYIPATAINAATQTVDVVPIPRTLTPAEMGQIVSEAVNAAVSVQVEPIKEEMRQLRLELDAHYRRVDERLREATNKPPKSFWQRIFGK